MSMYAGRMAGLAKAGMDVTFHFIHVSQVQAPNLSAARAFAFSASSSRFFGAALVSSEWRRRVEIPAISRPSVVFGRMFGRQGIQWAKAFGVYLWASAVVVTTMVWAARRMGPFRLTIAP